MDPATVFERGEVLHEPGDPLPGGDTSHSWVAVDPETDCRGLGSFEAEARAMLVNAVEAYHENPERTAPLVSISEVKTVEMSWRRESDPGIVDRIQQFLSD